MCLQYKPTVVACFCIHLACKWSNWQIPKSNEGKDWFYYVDKSVTSELLEQLTAEFLVIFDKCPSRLKRKILSISNNPHSGMEQAHTPNTSSNSPFDTEPRKTHPIEKEVISFHTRPLHDPKQQGVPNAIDDPHKKRPHEPSSSQQRVEYRDYRDREKKAERERLEREKQHHPKPGVPPVNKHLPPGAQPSKPPHSHHRPPPGVDPKHQQKIHHRPSSSRELEQIRDPNVSRENVPNAVNRDYMRETNGRDSREGLVHRQRDHQEVINRDVHRDQNKEVQKHIRPELTNKVDSEFNKLESDKQRFDTNRQKVDPKLLAKHDPNRHKYPKRPETVPVSENKKPVPNPSAQDKNSFINKQTNSTSQRHKSPFTDAPKSVPLLQTPTNYPVKSETRNGNHNTNSLPTIPVEKPWPETTEDPLSPIPKQRQPSLFSPEITTPPKKTNTKTPPSAKKNTETLPNTIPTAVSPFHSPPPKVTPGQLNKRHRSSSSSSEPELRPVVKKLDQISGFENIIRDSKMGIKLPKVPDIIQPICDRSSELPTETSISKELKPPDIIKPFNSSSDIKPLSQPLVNGIETDPTLISNLLKEVPPTLNHLPVIKKESPGSPEYPHLPVPQPVVTPVVAPVVLPTPEVQVEKHKSEHHHKSEKKKKKDKHKHKDKDKSKDEKEKKKKHKDKDKDKHKIKTEKVEEPQVEPPLKITIPKDKIIQPPPEPQSTGLKVKISKDRLKTDSIAENTGGLKLKISKDMIHYNSVTVQDGSRKREREKSSPVPGPPAKTAKTNYNRGDARQNGRNSYSKVSYNNNNRGRYGNNIPRMPPPQVFQPNQPPPFYVPNYPPPNVQMAQAWYPPDALYHHQFYGYQMYPPPEMYGVPPQPHDAFQMQPSNNPPPLPDGPPPNTPPPPPPE